MEWVLLAGVVVTGFVLRDVCRRLRRVEDVISECERVKVRNKKRAEEFERWRASNNHEDEIPPPVSSIPPEGTIDPRFPFSTFQEWKKKAERKLVEVECPNCKAVNEYKASKSGGFEIYTCRVCGKDFKFKCEGGLNCGNDSGLNVIMDPKASVELGKDVR